MNRWYLLLAVAVLLNGIANVMMKAGMKSATVDSGLGAMVKHYITSWPVMVGLLLFALNVVAYTQALTKLPLSVAYPIMVSMSGLIVVTCSMFIFKEAISWIQWIGFALILAGIVCITR